jgi:hypothetical protein
MIRPEIQFLLIFLSCIFLFGASFWNNDRSMGVCIVASRLYKILIEEVDSMRRSIFLALFILSAGCLLATAQQQNSPTALRGELRRLLSMPAPTPRVADDAEKRNAMPPRPPDFFDSAKTPPDDAPIADLLDYWERPRLRRRDRHVLEPSDATRRRLLAACEGEPERLPLLLELLPQDAATAERVKKLHDESLASDRFDEDWRKKVRDWLRFNSKYFLGELLALARKAKDKDGYVDGEEALLALVKVDWSTAEPLLQSLSGGGPRTAALANALLYRHAVGVNEESDVATYRQRLKEIAASRGAPARARDTAIDELSLSDWAGRDEWYLSLLADEALLEPRDGSYLLSPLTTLFDREPDKWIPVMAKLVESPNRATRQAAASCLVNYLTSDYEPRKDAILPVLRWLSDPEWLEINSSQRAWFIGRLDRIEIPESVPGLIWIIEHEEDNRGRAAQTLAHYKDPRAIPALKKALPQVSSYHIQHIIQCLLASGGLSDDEQLAALEAYANIISTPEGRVEVERYRGSSDAPLSTQIAIGQYLARQNEVSEGLASRALARAESLQSKAPTVARELLALAQSWQSRLVEADMLRRIGAGAADADTIVRALERRKRLRESVRRELLDLAGLGGAAPGIAAVLLADEALAQSVLDTGDHLAQIALLACARLTQMALPVEQVGSLLRGREADLTLAAERYLLVEDSPEARRLLLERHPNSAFITGWRENLQLIGGDNFDAMGRFEERLREEVLQENGPREIYALLADDKHGHRILRVYPSRAVYTYYEDAARYRERVISQAELAGFKDFITNNKLAEIGPQFGPCHHDCWAAEFLTLTRQGGRRVFSHQGTGGWITVIDNFYLLGQGDGARVHYYLEGKIKGLEVMYAGETPIMLDVWRQGADSRVFVERAATPEEIEEERKDEAVEDDDDDEDARAERRRREVARERARFSWRKLEGGALGEETTQPPGYSTFDEAAFEIEQDDFPAHLNDHLTQAVAGGSVVMARSSEEGGLWKKIAGGKPVRLSRDGAYANPLVTPDGKWAVAAKTDSHWGVPNHIVRLNLQTRREYRVNLPPADQFDSVAYIAAHNKVLLRRARDENNQDSKSISPEDPEFYLLDVATGRTQKVTGEFAPLLQEGRRSLQPTGAPFAYWAAIPDREKNRTRVGRYNSRDFSFQTTLDVQQLTFDSFSMWVDEKEAKLLVVYEGQLLRLPLP